MNPIDPREAALRAEEARRRADALARLRQQARVPAPPQGSPPQGRTLPGDVVERMRPTLFGSLAGAGPQARLDAEIDRHELAAALGPTASRTPSARPVPPTVSPGNSAIAIREGAAWARAASTILGGPLAALTEKARWLEARATQVEDTLAATDTRDARRLVGFRTAGGFLEKAAYHSGLARALAKQVPGDVRKTLGSLAAARQQFAEVQRNAGDAEAALRDVGPQARAMPRALQDVREIQQVASQARFEASRTESRGAMVAAASETVPTPAALGLGEDDLARIGSGLDPSHPPPQTSWSDHMLNTVCDLARQQGAVTTEEGERNAQLARSILDAESVTSPVELGAVELAALLKTSGVDLARVDPNQLQAASRYVSEATTLGEQQERLRKTLDTLQALAKTGLPTLTRVQMVDELWCVARVPGHALSKLSDAEVARKLQEVLATVNAGPGKSEIKIGKYSLKLEVGQNGTVQQSSCKKPGFFSKVWSGIKKVAPVALTVLSFIPVTAPFARAAQAVISIVKAIQAKSVIGFATAGAALVGAGAAIARGASTVVGTVERVANSVAHGLQGVSSIRQGSVLGGIASLGSAVAGGIGQAAGGAANGLERFGERLGQVSGRLQSVAQGVSAVQGYQAAAQAVRAARQALAQAQASGDPRAIAEAQRQLAEAERDKKAALLGGLGTAATIGADQLGGWGAPGPGEPRERGPAGSTFEASLRAAGRALSGAGNVVQKDWEALGASAIGFAAAARSAVGPESSVSQDPLQRRVDELLGRGPQVSTLNDASNLADAVVSQRQSSRAEEEANQAVKAAEAALEAAEAQGDAEAILAARANLARVRKSREGALMGAIGASDALLQTAAGIGRQREAARAFGTARDGVVRALDSAEKTAADAAAMAGDLPPDLSRDARELAGRLGDARTRFEATLQGAQGDPRRIEQATWGFLSEQMEVWAGLSLVEQEAAERLKPRIVPVSATAPVRPATPRESARVQIEMGRAQVKDARDEQDRFRMGIAVGGGASMPETPVEAAARGYEAALDRLQALCEGDAIDVDVRRAQMEVTLARTLFDEARNPRRAASDFPAWAVGLGTFVQEFGQGALAVVSMGGTAAMRQALETGRLDARSGFTDAVQVYFEGVFNGITFGGAGAFADARAGQGRGLPDSSAAALAASLKSVSGYDDVKTIFADPHANAYDKAQAMATLVAKWASLAALGISATRYARVEVPNPFGRKPVGGPRPGGEADTIAPETRGITADDSVYVTRYDPRFPGRPDPLWSIDTSAFVEGVRTVGGGIRNAAQFWKRWMEARPETISPNNRYLIEQLQKNPRGPSPRIDAQWVKYFPEHASYMKLPYTSRVLIHHHVNQGPIAIPVPGVTHVGSGGPWHGRP